MKKECVLLFLFVFLSIRAFPAGDSLIVRKEYTLVKTLKAPSIDGVLDDATWENTIAINDFREAAPYFNVRASQQMDVKMVYDNTALYIGAILYDTAPDSIDRQLGNRDDFLNADNFRIVFDTYNTQQDAFEFVVTASGVQQDTRFSDNSYNAVWESAVKIHDKGWSVEIRIPYSAIRFPNKPSQLWGMQITRNINRSGEFDQWALTPRGETNFYKYWGLLKGMENIKEPLRLSLTPYITAYTSHYPTNIEGESNYTSNLTGGMDLKYGINESFTVDATLLPDFSQVQSDNVVKNLNAFEVQYNEQRPFFQENTDLFQKGDLFYSRRIGRKPSGYYSAYSQINYNENILVNPDQAKLVNATKVSGRTARGLGMGLMNAVLSDTYATARDSAGNERKILTEPFSDYNILVFDKQLKNSSSVYLINTAVLKDLNYGHADVTGAGFNLNNKKNTYTVFAEGATSNILTPDSSGQGYDNLSGYKYRTNVAKISGKFQFTLYRNGINPTFNNNAMGITNETNFNNDGIRIRLSQFEPRGKILNADLSFEIDHSENFTTHRMNNINLHMLGNVTYKNFYHYYFGLDGNPVEGIDYYEARTPGRIFVRTQNVISFFGMNTDSRKPLSISWNSHAGSTIRISPTIRPNPFYGSNLNFKIRASNKLTFNIYGAFHIDDGDRGWVNNDSLGNVIFGVRKINNVENILSARYLFRNNLSLDLRARHYWSYPHSPPAHIIPSIRH